MGSRPQLERRLSMLVRYMRIPRPGLTLLVLTVFSCVMLVASEASASALDNIGNLGNLGGGSVPNFDQVLSSIIRWLEARLHQVLVIAGLGVGLVLLFNKNFMQLAESIAWVALIAGLLAFVIAGVGVGGSTASALGALVP